MNKAQAQERIEELRGFYSHLGTYIGVNLFLFVINMVNMSEGDSFWFIYPLFGWGIGLLSHAFHVFAGGQDWEKRKMEELTGLKDTQDELARLSERTDNLVTILSSVNWEKIDPDLVETRDNLEAAQERLAKLKQHSDAEGQKQVSQEIEKLEEFVTSSKFGFYELAATDKP